MAQGNGSRSGSTENTPTTGQPGPTQSTLGARDVASPSRDPAATASRESTAIGRAGGGLEEGVEHGLRGEMRRDERVREGRRGREGHEREGNDVKSHLGILRQDFSDLRDDLMGALESLFETSKERSGEAKDKLKESGRRAMEATEAQIKERPLLSIVLALLLGMIMARIFEGKHS